MASVTICATGMPCIRLGRCFEELTRNVEHLSRHIITAINLALWDFASAAAMNSMHVAQDYEPLDTTTFLL